MPPEKVTDRSRNSRKPREPPKKRDDSKVRSRTSAEAAKKPTTRTSSKSRQDSELQSKNNKKSDDLASKYSRTKPTDKAKISDRDKRKEKESVNKKVANNSSRSSTLNRTSKPSNRNEPPKSRNSSDRNSRISEQKTRLLDKNAKNSDSRRVSNREINKKPQDSRNTSLSKASTRTRKPQEKGDSSKNRTGEKKISRSQKEEPQNEQTDISRKKEDNSNFLSVAKPKPAKIISDKPAPPEHDSGEPSLETQESGISVTTPRVLSQDDSDAEVEESFSSRFVEVDEAEVVDEIMEEDISMEQPAPFVKKDYDEEDIPMEQPAPFVKKDYDEEDIPMEQPAPFVKKDYDEEDIPMEQPAPFVKKDYDEEDIPMEQPAPSVKKDYDEQPVVKDEPPPENVEESYTDDDFEDYESDFEEEEESVSDEKSESEPVTEDDDDESEDFDNELQESNEINVQNSPITKYEEATTSQVQIQKEVTDENLFQPDEKREVSKTANATSFDEGIKDEIARIMRPKTSKSFVNFAKLKERKISTQAGSQTKSRGQILRGMITLDTVYTDILTLHPINYDTFISSFGLLNMQQAGVQTKEDDLDQETQVERVEMLDKWTQQPISIDVGPNMSSPPTPADYLGVGGDTSASQSKEDIFGSRSAGDIGRLTKFLSSASMVVLSLLEEDSVYNNSSSYVSGGNLSHGTGGGGFSNHGVLLGGSAGEKGATSIAALLSGSNVTCVRFSSNDASLVLTGHSFENKNSQMSEDGESGVHSSSGLVCVWSVNEPSQPKHILRCNSAPLSFSLCPGKPIIVIVGMKDNTIAAWDLREHSHLHPLATLDHRGRLEFITEIETRETQKEGEEGMSVYSNSWRVRVPSFITACNSSTDSIESETEDELGYKSSIISLQTIEQQQDNADEDGAFQVVSLSDSGELIWWVVLQQKGARVTADDVEVDISPHAGATPWSKVVINRSFSTYVSAPQVNQLSPINSWVWCTSCQLNPYDNNSLFVSTGTGAVRQISRLNQRMNPPAYLPEIEPNCSSTCVSVCPHLSSYLLVGCSDGSVRLHKVNSPKPLATWSSPYADNPQPVKDITWSSERPCVFYVHEEKCIHVWDLSAGDMLPVASLSTNHLMGEEGAMVCGIATTRLHKRPVVNAVFGSSSGRLILRTIEPDFLCKSEEDYEMELERFNVYINII